MQFAQIEVVNSVRFCLNHSHSLGFTMHNVYDSNDTFEIHHFCQFVTKRHPKLALSSKYLGAYSCVGPSKITYRLYLIESKLIKIVHCVTIYCNLNFFIVSTYAPIIFDRVLHSLNYSQNRQFHWHFLQLKNREGHVKTKLPFLSKLDKNDLQAKKA